MILSFCGSKLMFCKIVFFSFFRISNRKLLKWLQTSNLLKTAKFVNKKPVCGLIVSLIENKCYFLGGKVDVQNCCSQVFTYLYNLTVSSQNGHKLQILLRKFVFNFCIFNNVLFYIK